MGMRAKKSITVQLLIFFMIIWGVISILLMSVLYWTQQLMTETILEGQKSLFLHSNCDRSFESNYLFTAADVRG